VLHSPDGLAKSSAGAAAAATATLIGEPRPANWQDVRRIAELAELCGLSRRQFTRAFREETGQTISSYLQNLTLQRAKTLLCETDEPIQVIAAKVGFSCASAFTIAFSRATGSSPRTYRYAMRARRQAAARSQPQA
jgi:transcriptional regulator GlxA family with amidase domain